ncbi:hypothetical protein [Sphingobium sufflavum]|nr:hypothetical protein [Sphingobium sufflavum]
MGKLRTANKRHLRALAFAVQERRRATAAAVTPIEPVDASR